MPPNKAVSATEDTEVATSYNFSHDDAVTLVVGPEKTKMTVHGAYLARDLEFFKAALKKEWVEGQTQVIKLPEEDPKTMAHYMSFVYHNKLPFEHMIPKERRHFNARWPILIDLYVCGERFIHHAIQNAVIEEMLRLTHLRCPKGLRWFPTGSIVAAIYEGTPVGSPIRRLIVDMHVIHGSKDWLSTNASAEFLMDVTKAFYDKSGHHNAQSKLKKMELDSKDYVIDA